MKSHRIRILCSILLLALFAGGCTPFLRPADVIEAELRTRLHLSELEATEMLLTVCKVVAHNISTGQAAALRTNLPTEMKELFPSP